MWPTGAPSPWPEYCEPECVAGTSAAQKRSDSIPEWGTCKFNSIAFTAGDLSKDYCGCDFDTEGAFNHAGTPTDWTSVDLTLACGGMWAHDDRAALEQTCQNICTQVDNDSGTCTAWSINWSDGVCYLWTCESGVAAFRDAPGHSAGLPCNKDMAHGPTPEPTKMRRRQLADVIPYSGRSNVEGRELERSRPLHLVNFYVLFPSQETREAALSTMDMEASSQALTSQLEADPAFAGTFVRTAGFSLGKTYHVDDLRFPKTDFDPIEHTSQQFMDAVCLALEKTVDTTSNLSRVRCGKKLFMKRSFADADGKLVMLYRIVNVGAGRIQDLLASSKGQAMFQRQLKASKYVTVSKLEASYGGSEDQVAEDGLPTAAIVGAAAGFVGLAAFAAFVVVRKQQRKPKDADLELHDMVAHYKGNNA